MARAMRWVLVVPASSMRGSHRSTAARLAGVTQVGSTITAGAPASFAAIATA